MPKREALPPSYRRPALDEALDRLTDPGYPTPPASQDTADNSGTSGTVGNQGNQGNQSALGESVAEHGISNSRGAGAPGNPGTPGTPGTPGVSDTRDALDNGGVPSSRPVSALDTGGTVGTPSTPGTAGTSGTTDTSGAGEKRAASTTGARQHVKLDTALAIELRNAVWFLSEHGRPRVKLGEVLDEAVSEWLSKVKNQANNGQNFPHVGPLR